MLCDWAPLPAFSLGHPRMNCTLTRRTGPTSVTRHEWGFGSFRQVWVLFFLFRPAQRHSNFFLTPLLRLQRSNANASTDSEPCEWEKREQIFNTPLGFESESFIGKCVHYQVWFLACASFTLSMSNTRPTPFCCGLLRRTVPSASIDVANFKRGFFPTLAKHNPLDHVKPMFEQKPMATGLKRKKKYRALRPAQHIQQTPLSRRGGHPNHDNT